MMKTPYYVFYADDFIRNFHELEDTFRAAYQNYQIAYSFKTNYVPAVLKIVLELGGYAEVVSDMEYGLALKVGFPDDKIIYNGPGKGEMLTRCLENGGHLHIDNKDDLRRTISYAREHADSTFKVAVRANFDVGNGLLSRFGFDVDNGDYEKAVKELNEEDNIMVTGLHFHISRARGLDAWKKRIDKALEIADAAIGPALEYIDIGSGMYGHLDPALQEQFGDTPNYKEYADVVLKRMADHFPDHHVKLLTEPGTTLVSKYFHLFTSVLDIKNIRDKDFALLDSSFHNVGEICGLKKVPIINNGGHEGEAENYQDIDLVGYTCLEQDVICKNYSGELGVGDRLEILNVGGYSIVDKPPFIHPDIPIFMEKDGTTTCVKRAQTLDDIFAPYYF